MAFPVTFLSAGDTPLTKQYWLDDGILTKASYPHVSNFTSETHSVDSLETFYTLIKKNAAQHNCLLKGQILKDLHNESRAGSTDRSTPTQWICLDIDGLQGVGDERELINQIPCLKDVSYIRQVSSSMGMEPDKGLSVHLFYILDNQVEPQILKNWLIHLNLSVEILKKNLKLSKTHVTLKWPLDISTCQNDKLLYIAPPILLTEGMIDGYEGERITLVAGKISKLHIDLESVSVERNDTEKLHAINTLRKEFGLRPKKKETYKLSGEIEYLANPGIAQVTGEKKERGYVYLNINGGDSWGYYYPEGQPEFLFNFKGEPVYKTSELLPQYWRKIYKPLSDVAETGKGIYWLAFKDKTTQQYYIGSYDYDTRTLDLDKTDSFKKLQDFLKEHGQPLPDYIPTWRYEVDFQSDVEFDPENKFINKYIRSKYIKNAKPTDVVPPLTDKLLTHTFGDLKEHFLNWAAVIVQHKIRTNMAWILTGTQGSGKGVIINNLLMPLIGLDHVHILNDLGSFESEFNKHLEQTLLVFVDESCMTSITRYTRAVNKIKGLITEKRISIRQMRTDSYMVWNSNNFIFASNQYDPMQIDVDDRRFIVPERQNKKLMSFMSKQEIEEGLESELYDFAGYLLTREADKLKASTVIDTEERQRLTALHVDSGAGVANAINKGDLQFFVDNIPEADEASRIEAILNIDNAPRYVDIVNEFITTPPGEECKIPRKHLQVIFFHTSGIKHDNVGQFTKHLSHKGLNLKQIWYKGKNTRGITTVWNTDEELLKEWHEIYKLYKPDPDGIKLVKSSN